jgi:molybdate/tungstate transport system substrate-binding protein
MLRRRVFQLLKMVRSRRSVLRAVGGATACGAVGTFLYGQSMGPDAGATDVDALVAGSLLRVARATSGAAIEAHGSAAVRRLVLNELRTPDVVALADPRLFEGIADRATLFATNALVLVYDRDSTYAGAIERDWKQAIESERIVLGRTDPDRDPLGYRTVMAAELAERPYGLDAQSVLDDAEVLPETDLLSALEAGGLDAAFAYQSMAVERGLAYRSLPARIDFSDPAFAERYASVAYDLDGEPIRGTPIRYGAAAITERGRTWVERLVSSVALLRESGFEVPAAYPIRDASVDLNEV